MTDEEIYQGLKGNDAQTITFIYNYYKPKALGWVIRKGKGYNLQDGEDIFNNTILAIVKSIRENRYEQRGLFSAFFWTCLRSYWLTESRRRNRKPISSDESEALSVADETDFFNNIIKNERLNAIFEALKRLGEPCLSSLRRFHLEGASCHDLAVEQNVSDNTMTQRLHRCRQALRALMPKD